MIFSPLQPGISISISASCIGVDGAKNGWIAVWRDGERLEFSVYRSAGELVAAHRQADVIAIDIPIGLPDSGGRAADSLARAFVGGKRASSIFSSPVRGILDATSQQEASQRHREIDGRGFGAQAFGILPKIREWDDLLRSDAAARWRVHEIHPEVSFAALSGGKGLAESKKTLEGIERRRSALAPVFGEALIGNLLERVPRKIAAADDVLDALVALWSAQRIFGGHSQTLPSPPERDSQGLTRAIHY